MSTLAPLYIDRRGLGFTCQMRSRRCRPLVLGVKKVVLPPRVLHRVLGLVGPLWLMRSVSWVLAPLIEDPVSSPRAWRGRETSVRLSYLLVFLEPSRDANALAACGRFGAHSSGSLLS